MLLVGLKPDAPEDGDVPMAGDLPDFAPQRLACEQLGAVMMALLPGIDANDAKKTKATITLYLSVFSNCVAITGVDMPAEDGDGVLQLGFCIEEFAVGLIQRLFSVIQDLEVPAGAADGTSSVGCAARVPAFVLLARPHIYAARIVRLWLPEG